MRVKNGKLGFKAPLNDSPAELDQRVQEPIRS